MSKVEIKNIIKKIFGNSGSCGCSSIIEDDECDQPEVCENSDKEDAKLGGDSVTPALKKSNLK